MSESFIEPRPIDSKFENITAIIDNDGTVKILNRELSSYNFDGLIPLTSSVILVNQIRSGMMFLPIGASAGTLNTVLSFDFDDPEMTASPSSDYILYYLGNNGEIDSLQYSGSSQITVLYENWDEKLLGSNGWTITQGGNAIFSNVAVRGTVEAVEGNIGGWLITNQSASVNGALFFDGSIEPGSSGSGVYLTGIYTGFGTHTASWQQETDTHQPSKIFIIYGPGMDSSSISNLTPHWNDPNSIFYVDGHGYFSLGDKLTFDANTSILRANSAFFSGSVIGGYIEGIDMVSANIRSTNSITASAGDGVYLDGLGRVRFSGPGGTLSFDPDIGLFLSGYTTSSYTDLQILNVLNNIRTASTVLGSEIITASSTLNAAILSASAILKAEVDAKINSVGATLTSASISSSLITSSSINNTFFISGSIVGGIISDTTILPVPVQRATYANNLDSTVTGGATIYGTGVLIDSISSAAGTTLVRSTADNTLKLSSSSRRYKENIIDADINESWIQSSSLNLKLFNYIGDSITQIGLIAEDVATIDEIKQIVNFNMDGEPESIQYDRFGLLLIPIVKDLIEKVETLQNRVIQLESQLGG